MSQIVAREALIWWDGREIEKGAGVTLDTPTDEVWADLLFKAGQVHYGEPAAPPEVETPPPEESAAHVTPPMSAAELPSHVGRRSRPQ